MIAQAPTVKPVEVAAHDKNIQGPARVARPTSVPSGVPQNDLEEVVTAVSAPSGQHQTRVMLYPDTLNAEIRNLNPVTKGQVDLGVDEKKDGT